MDVDGLGLYLYFTIENNNAFLCIYFDSQVFGEYWIQKKNC